MSRLHREMMGVLIAEIVSGQRPAGEMLPREVDLAADFGVSRGVARECIRAMEERGLISVRHGRGATVSPSERWDVFDPDVLASVLDGEGGNDLLAEYLECRRIIEVEAAGLAAERATAAALEAAGEALARMQESAGRSGRAAELRFHEADVVVPSGAHPRRRQSPARGPRRAHPRRLSSRASRWPGPSTARTARCPEHRRILDAVASGDVMEARKAMNDAPRHDRRLPARARAPRGAWRARAPPTRWSHGARRPVTITWPESDLPVEAATLGGAAPRRPGLEPPGCAPKLGARAPAELERGCWAAPSARSSAPTRSTPTSSPAAPTCA